MKTRKGIRLIAGSAFIAANLASFAFAGDVSNCERVMTQVRAAVEKSPQKVLVILEDAMVANESCACEIVKACIVSSKANADLVKQIVLTATNVSPRMGPVIAECAAAVAPAQGGAIADTVKKVTGENVADVTTGSGKEGSGKEGSGVIPGPDGNAPGSGKNGVSGTGSEDDYRTAPQDIRGVYLIQPSTGTATATSTTPKIVTEKQVVYKKVIVRRSPAPLSSPQSQSYAGVP